MKIDASTDSVRNTDYKDLISFDIISKNQDTKNVNVSKLIITWDKIEWIESYPEQANEDLDWKEYKDVDKMYIKLRREDFYVVLFNFDTFLKYWRYYHKIIKTDIYDK